jgi:hypothetical protein
MTIKLKVIKGQPPTWYHNQIGKIFYADNKVDKNGFIRQTSEFGIETRFLFRIDNIEVLQGELDKSGFGEGK